jgi:hypothetical protein
MCVGQKIKKHQVGMSVGSLVLSIFCFSVRSQWFSFQFNVCRFCFLHLAVTPRRQPQYGVYLLFVFSCVLIYRVVECQPSKTARIEADGSCVPCMSIVQRTLVVSCRKSLNIQINFTEQTTSVFFQRVKFPYTPGTPGTSIMSAHGAGHGWEDEL